MRLREKKIGFNRGPEYSEEAVDLLKDFAATAEMLNKELSKKELNNDDPTVQEIINILDNNLSIDSKFLEDIQTVLDLIQELPNKSTEKPKIGFVNESVKSRLQRLAGIITEQYSDDQVEDPGCVANNPILGVAASLSSTGTSYNMATVNAVCDNACGENSSFSDMYSQEDIEEACECCIEGFNLNLVNNSQEAGEIRTTSPMGSDKDLDGWFTTLPNSTKLNIKKRFSK